MYLAAGFLYTDCISCPFNEAGSKEHISLISIMFSWYRYCIHNLILVQLEYKHLALFWYVCPLSLTIRSATYTCILFSTFIFGSLYVDHVFC